jgi:nucleoid-associated protein YgaU
MESRIPRLIPGALSLLLLAACGDATESSPGKSLDTLESDIRQARQQLERSRQTLAVSEGQLSTLAEERSRDHRRIADMSADHAALEQRNRDMALRLTRARGQLARGANAGNSLRQQRDQNARRVRELDEAYQAMSARLAGAYGEIRRLEASRSPQQRQIADLYHRSAAAARELTELRRYNSYLLQERSNLQAWLRDADGTREKQRDALRQSQQEADRHISRATASNKKLRQDLEAAHQASADLKASRDALAEEASTLRETVALATQAERSRGDQAAEKIAQLQAAKSYLVEKIEICTQQQQSAGTQSRRHAWNLALLSQALGRNSDAAARQQKPPRLMTAQWQPGPGITASRQSPLIPVAGQSDEQADGTRHKKELKATKQKLKELEQEQEALTKELQELKAEHAAVKKQVQTLTWANEVLVKELDAAYATGTSAPLPEGTRGIYVLRQGESLSRVANAFYGDPERWKDIVAANKDKIPDPNIVRAGTIILIPE